MLLDGRKGDTMTGLTVRPMAHADLKDAAEITNAAFGALAERSQVEQTFPFPFFELRFGTDARGCFVAVDETGSVVGALFSVARGTLGWFGPLATRPDLQHSGVGEALVAECLATWSQRDIRLTGLETFADSRFHVQFYGRMGFRPAWTGVALRGPTWERSMPAGVETGGLMPDLDFVYPGLDVYAEAAATTAHGAGQVLTTEGGVAIVHAAGPDREDGFVPFLAARTRASFDRLLAGAEHVVRGYGRQHVLVRTSGSAWATLDALAERGYRHAGVMVRMKAGENLDYDRGEKFYLDSWL